MATSSSIGCFPTADDAFGPIVQNCRQGFDFTLAFEQCLFTILPALLLLLAAPLRLRHLAKLPRAVSGTALRLAKQAAIGVLAVLQLALVALWATHREAGRLRTVSIVASCASFAAAVMFGGLSSIEHAKSLKPSSILNIYMLVSLVLDGAILRTVWLSHLSVTISAVFSASFALKAVIVILEAWGKTPYLAGGRRSYSPEETSGIYSRGLFWWLTPLLLTGFRRLLKPLDLFVLDRSMSTAVLDERFWRDWNKASSFSAAVQPDASPLTKRHRLIRTCVSTLKWQLLAVILPRIFLLGFTICQPLILNRFLDFLQNTPEDVNYGYGLIGAYGFVYLGISISSSFYWHKAFRSLAMLRGILVTAVYSKTTELRVAPGDNAAAVTLMSTDVDAIIRAWREVHEFWANTIQIALATWLLSTHLGYAASGPIVVSVIALIATVFFAPAAQKYQVIWVEKVQRRIGIHFPPNVSDAVLTCDKGITSAMIGHIKSIKMSGLTQKLSETLADLRIDEMKAATPFRVIGAITSAVAQVPLMLAPVVAFAMYTTIAAKTVRKNIICFSEFDLHLYRQVLKACDLEKDLAQLPEEDLTIIGSKGIVLSGGQKQRVTANDTTFQVIPERKTKAVEEQDDKRRQLGDWSVYGYYFGSVGTVLVAIMLFLQVTWAFFSTFPTIWLKFWTDANLEAPGRLDAYYLGIYAALQVGGLFSFAVLIWFVLVPVAAKSGINLHQRLLKAVVQFSQDIGLIDRSLPLALVISLASFFTCIGKAFLIASASWYIAISFPVLILVFYYIQRAYLRTSRQLRLLDLEEKAPIYTHFLETLSGLATLRAHALTHASITRSHALIDRSQRPFYILLLTQQWLTLVLDLATAALAVLVVGVAVRLRATASIGLTGVSLIQLISFTETLKMLIQFWTSLETSIGAVARIKNFSEETVDEVGDDRLTRHDRALETDLKSGWPDRGVIEICDVSASYDATGPGEDGKTAATRALDGISISIRPGEKIGVVGRTGSGKSSLLLALLRLLPLSSGTISIDGRPIDSLPLLPLRSALIAITQDQFILPGTVRQNLDPLGTASAAGDAAVESALARLGLWDTIRDNGGLDADFAEEALSHGQRQLFFLARAILRRHVGRVVLLDEATSSIDAQTEKMVRDLVREEFNDHTVIAIAHRLGTVADFDRVVVLDKGRVVEVGNPQDLLLRANGRFRELWDASRQHGSHDDA
ncbi:ABC transporter C family member 8 [Colletotrichum higginsianum]|uniref:ABC transporter C family member 8 n=1 Tax=Colletotrichum higginsianum TaxID=80884 RepID=A0A4T0VS59_9PEZI|nr:ABC transporter C family member 8 [Colletotrichum higginsianum]